MLSVIKLYLGENRAFCIQFSVVPLCDAPCKVTAYRYDDTVCCHGNASAFPDWARQAQNGIT